MLTNKNETVYETTAKLTVVDKELCKAYIKGAVHSFCNNNPARRFTARALFGGKNTDWSDTPLDKIYQYHKYIASSDNPNKQAAIDVGRLLKAVLIEDTTYTYEMIDGYVNEYQAIEQ